VPPLLHLTSCTLTKCNLNLANSQAAAVSEPTLYRILTFHVPNLMSLLHCLRRTKVSVQAQSTCICFVTRPVFKVRNCWHLAQPPKLEDHPLSALRDCLFNIFAATLHIGGRSSIGNMRTHHAVVTGTRLSLRKVAHIFQKSRCHLKNIEQCG